MPSLFARSHSGWDSSSGYEKSRRSWQAAFMLVCCLAMVGGTLIVVASAPAGSSFAARFGLVLPLIGCAALHLIMHKMMGGCAITARGKNNKNGERSDV